MKVTTTFHLIVYLHHCATHNKGLELGGKKIGETSQKGSSL